MYPGSDKKVSKISFIYSNYLPIQTSYFRSCYKCSCCKSLVLFCLIFFFLIVKNNFAEHKWEFPMSTVGLITKKRLQVGVPTNFFAGISIFSTSTCITCHFFFFTQKYLIDFYVLNGKGKVNMQKRCFQIWKTVEKNW